MKVARKPTYLLQDCFEAEERDAHVRISRHRNTIIIDAFVGNKWAQVETSLAGLAKLLIRPPAKAKRQP